MKKITEAPRSHEDLDKRTKLQSILLQKCYDDGILEPADYDGMLKVFTKVSEIIDFEDHKFDSINQAYKSGDYNFAADMILDILKKEL